jgi:hypothetical protein
VSRARAARTPTPMIEDHSANTPIPDANRIADQQPLLGESRTAKEPPESGTAPKRVRFETIASPDSGSTASYPPYPLHKHMHQQQQKEPDVTVSKNGGFGSLFTSATPALGGGRAPTKEQQQQVNIKNTGIKNFRLFSANESEEGHFGWFWSFVIIIFGYELGTGYESLKGRR